VSRAQLEALCEDLLARVTKPLEAVLQQANVTLDQGACLYVCPSLCVSVYTPVLSISPHPPNPSISLTYPTPFILHHPSTQWRRSR